MRNDDERTTATDPIRTPVSMRLARLLNDDCPLALSAWADGAIGRMHLRILAVQARRLPVASRPCFDELGTALARELSWRAFLPVATNLRRHLGSGDA